MPLVANSNLPTFDRLRNEGETVIQVGAALQQDIRELHIGLLNMMPDAALAATERQFFRLVGEANQIAQFYMHPFTLKQLPRGAKGRAHVEAYYESFEDIKTEGLDALIISGAQPRHPELSQEVFWEPLIEVIDWAYANVTSTICSCLATHAIMEFRYGRKRRALGEKRWGVFNHRVTDRKHPLVNGVNTRFDVPHSRFNEISRAQFESAGLKVLAESDRAGVHMAVSEDGFRLVLFQGHPEYDLISLLKEYKRETLAFAKSERADYPPFPENYFPPRVRAILDEHQTRLRAAIEQGAVAPSFPENLIAARLDNTWHDTGEAILNNWIGHVYQLTNQDRRLPFMQGVDPDDPLGLRR